jgi:hypothetical protein
MNETALDIAEIPPLGEVKAHSVALATKFLMSFAYYGGQLPHNLFVVRAEALRYNAGKSDNSRDVHEISDLECVIVDAEPACRPSSIIANYYCKPCPRPYFHSGGSGYPQPLIILLDKNR